MLQLSPKNEKDRKTFDRDFLNSKIGPLTLKARDLNDWISKLARIGNNYSDPRRKYVTSIDLLDDLLHIMKKLGVVHDVTGRDEANRWQAQLISMRNRLFDKHYQDLKRSLRKVETANDPKNLERHLKDHIELLKKNPHMFHYDIFSENNLREIIMERKQDFQRIRDEKQRRKKQQEQQQPQWIVHPAREGSGNALGNARNAVLMNSGNFRNWTKATKQMVDMIHGKSRGLDPETQRKIRDRDEAIKEISDHMEKHRPRYGRTRLPRRAYERWAQENLDAHQAEFMANLKRGFIKWGKRVHHRNAPRGMLHGYKYRGARIEDLPIHALLRIMQDPNEWRMLGKQVRWAMIAFMNRPETQRRIEEHQATGGEDDYGGSGYRRREYWDAERGTYDFFYTKDRGSFATHDSWDPVWYTTALDRTYDPETGTMYSNNYLREVAYQSSPYSQGRYPYKVHDNMTKMLRTPDAWDEQTYYDRMIPGHVRNYPDYAQELTRKRLEEWSKHGADRDIWERLLERHRDALDYAAGDQQTESQRSSVGTPGKIRWRARDIDEADREALEEYGVDVEGLEGMMEERGKNPLDRDFIGKLLGAKDRDQLDEVLNEMTGSIPGWSERSPTLLKFVEQRNNALAGSST